jgi:hypothetical protein
MSILFLLFLIFDASLVLFFFWKTVKGYFFLKGMIDWESAAGKMIFLEKKKFLNNIYCYPVVEFKTSNHKTVSFRSEKINEKKFMEEKKLNVLYDPYDSNKAVIQGYENGKFKEGLMGTVALTIFNIVLAMLFLLIKFIF